MRVRLFVFSKLDPKLVTYLNQKIFSTPLLRDTNPRTSRKSLLNLFMIVKQFCKSRLTRAAHANNSQIFSTLLIFPDELGRQSLHISVQTNNNLTFHNAGITQRSPLLPPTRNLRRDFHHLGFLQLVICFDHRKSTLKTIESPEACLEKVKFHVDVERSSSRAVYEYFSSELKQNQKVGSSLLDSKDQERVELLLSYIEDVDLRRWRLTDINAFKIGMGEWRSRMNCITNPFMFDQLMELKVEDLVSNGNSLIQPCKDAAKNVLDKAFKLRLGKGIYGECLAVRADGNSHLSDEIGKELSLRSSAAGLRPIGAVIYMQRNNLKMCLRSVDSSADTSEIAKAYGGGGRPSSSSFIIRMDEYNQWLSVNASCKA
ncbi:hypothetical protein V2J09_002587 [Rumex salicifolius]